MKKKTTDIGRRTFLKATVAAAAAPMILTPRKSAAQVVVPPSPATTPWVEDLPNAITPLSNVSLLTPQPTEWANTAGGECGRGNHQNFNALGGPTAELYEMTAKQNPNWRFNGNNPLYPPQPIWGYAGTLPDGSVPDATTPGPTLYGHYGHPAICRIRNLLPPGHVGFGTPEISTHLHNLHTPSESDGFPGDFYSPTKAGPTLASPGQFKDHFYPNVYAGLESYGGIGDPREALGTLWYHDHTMDFTAPNVYRGLAGFYCLFDELDSGNETDSPPALKLPSHPYDYPFILQDKRFDAAGKLTFNQISPEGMLGDKVTVNGKIEPVLRVARRKYRLRFLNGGPSRFYEMYLMNSSATTSYTYTYIANDGNLLPRPLRNQFKFRLGVAERADIVVDFSRFPLGTVLYFVNQLQQDTTRKPGNVRAPGTKVLKIIVDRNVPAGSDVSQVPNSLRELPPLPSAAALAALPVRRWQFARSGGLWTINGQLFNVFTPRASMAKGAEEIWELANADNGWHHPIHIHFEEGRLLSRTINGVNVPIPPHEQGRKDVYVITGPNEVLRIFLRFRDFKGKYPMHCHNLIHEDHAMMLRWDIV